MAKQSSIPKRIAGIKVPKQVRRGIVGEFLGSRTGRMIVAAVLVELGVVAAKVLDPATPTGRGVRHALKEGASALYPAGKGAKKMAKQRMTLLSHAFERAIEAFRSAMNTEREEAQDLVADVIDTNSADVEKKGRRASREVLSH